MTFEQLRITYQSDEQMARALFAELAQAHAMIDLIEAQRDKLKNKLAPPPARRTHRGEK